MKPRQNSLRGGRFATMDDGGAVGIPVSKVVVPRLPDTLLDRPALDQRILEACRRRVTLVVARAGFGKTTAVAAALDQSPAPVWYQLDAGDRTLSRLVLGLVDALRLRVPELAAGAALTPTSTLGPESGSDERPRARATAGAIAEALRQSGREDLVLIVDDLHELDGAEGPLAFVEALCRNGPSHVVLTSRTPVPFPFDRLRGQGELAELGAADLAFSQGEVAQLLGAWVGDGGPELAEQVVELTGGWPVGVRLAAEALAAAPRDGRSEVLTRLSKERGALQRYLLREVLDAEPATTRQLLEVLVAVPEADGVLCAELVGTDVAGELADLEQRGIFLRPGSGPGWVRLGPLVREVLQASSSAATLRRMRDRALRWFTDRGYAAQALAVAAAMQDPDVVVPALERFGTAALAAGRVDLILELCGDVPPDHRTPRVQQLHGEALRLAGSWDEALVQFKQAARADGSLPAGHAWRAGLIHYQRGDLNEALAVFRRAVRDGSAPADEALLLAWESAVRWRRGDIDAAEATAKSAFALATSAGDDQALAAAHTALAMVAAAHGNRRDNDSHYLQALERAERAGDALQTIRIRTNRASFFLEEGAAEQALAEADAALRLTNLTGFAAFHSLALTNRAEALLMLGRLDESQADLRAAEAIEQRLRSLDIRYPLLQLGELYRLRGDRSLARTAYAETLRLSESADDLQSLVPALAGLARVLAEEDPEGARALAERAVNTGSGMGHTAALLAVARVHLAADNLGAAAEQARMAHEAAITRRDRPAIAEALEIQGLAQADRVRALALIEEARGIWEELGNPIGVLRTLLAAGRLMATTDGEVLAEHAERELHARGAHGAVSDVPAGRRARRPIEIHCLGGFRLLRDGAVVPVTEWQSRKARDLLKLLVARRGRPVPRETLMASLWPDEPPERLGNRLSVALSTVRGVLDPAKQYPSDWFVVADQNAVALDLDHVAVDVEDFLSGAERGLALVRRGKRDEGLALLTAVEPRYRGEFLEEDLYEDWAADLREQARAVYVALLRVVADAAARDGDHDGAVRRHLRLLERDPYDEEAHLQLVRTLVKAGRHGEGRRHYATYAARMDELELEAAPFPT
jgi:ATP/maltotriose-dependent transcriptional regulator MalT/DNA-binding SARP family transcriptional activator